MTYAFDERDDDKLKHSMKKRGDELLEWQVWAECWTLFNIDWLTPFWETWFVNGVLRLH